MVKQLIFIILTLISFDLTYTEIDLEINPKESSIINALVKTKWKGSGTLMGNDATFIMDWKWVLDDEFLKLEFQNKRVSGKEEVTFKAMAFYRITDDSQIVGNWFDNRGISFPLTGNIKDNVMTIIWGDDDTERGKTIYTYNEHDKIEVEDFILSNNEYHKFGYAIYEH